MSHNGNTELLEKIWEEVDNASEYENLTTKENEKVALEIFENSAQ